MVDPCFVTISTEKLIMNEFFFPIFLQANPYMLLGLTKKEIFRRKQLGIPNEQENI
jgi:hypothetical protein